jgi:hypothetical protein
MIAATRRNTSKPFDLISTSGTWRQHAKKSYKYKQLPQSSGANDNRREGAEAAHRRLDGVERQFHGFIM